MRQLNQGVLLTCVPPTTLSALVPLLQRDGLSLQTCDDAQDALVQLELAPPRVLVTGYPLPDLDVSVLVDAIRSHDERRTCGLIVVAPPYQMERARQWIGRGVNRVISTADGSKAVEEAVADLLSVAPRKEARVPVRLHVVIHDNERWVLARTHDVSASGMLIRMPNRYPLGTVVEFRLTLQDDAPPVSGDAVLVRATRRDREPISGVGARFTRLENGALRVLERFLADTTRGH